MNWLNLMAPLQPESESPIVSRMLGHPATEGELRIEDCYYVVLTYYRQKSNWTITTKLKEILNFQVNQPPSPLLRHLEEEGKSALNEFSSEQLWDEGQHLLLLIDLSIFLNKLELNEFVGPFKSIQFYLHPHLFSLLKELLIRICDLIMTSPTHIYS